MAIVQIPSNVVITKQPKVYVYHNGTATSGVYYTLVNISNTRGVLSKVTMSIATTTNNNCNLRISIDGVTNTFGNPTAKYGAIGLNHGDNTTNSWISQNSFDYFCNITFFNSLTVELMQSSGGNQNVVGNVMYSTE
jgi:hypothetical protein